MPSLSMIDWICLAVSSSMPAPRRRPAGMSVAMYVK
jgi:hypothetical protein